MMEYHRRARRHRPPLGLNWLPILAVAVIAALASVASAGLAALLLQLFGLVPQ